MKFSIKDFFIIKCDRIRGFLRICSHLLKKKSLMENFIFCAVHMLMPDLYLTMLLRKFCIHTKWMFCQLIPITNIFHLSYLMAK